MQELRGEIEPLLAAIAACVALASMRGSDADALALHSERVAKMKDSFHVRHVAYLVVGAVELYDGALCALISAVAALA